VGVFRVAVAGCGDFAKGDEGGQVEVVDCGAARPMCILRCWNASNLLLEFG